MVFFSYGMYYLFYYIVLIIIIIVRARQLRNTAKTYSPKRHKLHVYNTHGCAMKSNGFHILTF